VSESEPDHEVDHEVDHEAVAKALALRLLTRGPRSRAQLGEAMARKDVPEDVAQAVLDRFTEVGLIDDAEYARMLVRARLEDRGLARRALRVELRRKGIDDEVASMALRAVDEDLEETTARELARRRLAGSRGLAREVRMRRAVAMLGRKGYSSGLAVKIVCELLAAEGPSAAGEPNDDTEAADMQASGYFGDD
jgi:regulatory protein